MSTQIATTDILDDGPQILTTESQHEYELICPSESFAEDSSTTTCPEIVPVEGTLDTILVHVRFTDHASQYHGRASGPEPRVTS